MAPTGSGRTTRYVVPNVLLAEGSVVVTDPAGEIFRATSAGNVLFVALSAIANVEDPAFVNPGNVRHLLNHLDADSPRVRGFLIRHLGAAKDDDSLLSEYRAFDSMDSRVKTSILATARAALALWSDPAVADLTTSSSLDLHQLLSG